MCLHRKLSKHSVCIITHTCYFILGNIRNNIFLGYTRQDGDFDNGEFLGGDNFALGLKSVYENNGFKASFTPMIGLNDLTVTDFDTDTK